MDVRDEFIAEFLALWALLDTNRLDDTGPGWVAAVTRAIVAYRLLSAEIATRYYWEFRAAEAPDSVARPRVPFDEPSRPTSPRPGRADRRGSAFPRPDRRRQTPPRRSDGFQGRRAPRELERAIEGSGIRWDIDEDAIARSLQRPGARIEIPDIDWSETDRKVEIDLNIAGPIGQKSKIGKGRTPTEARDLSLVESSGAASRHVLTGGRRSLLTLVRDDMQAIGWVRVTDGDPCYFCAMLASRGPVYKKGSFSASDPRFTGPGNVKVHDHCACTLEAVYSRNAAWPGRAQEFHRLWREHIHRRYSGKEARRQWRRIYTQLQREGRLSEIA